MSAGVRLPLGMRCLVGPWIAAPLLVMLVVNAAQRGPTWRGDVLLGVDAQGIVLFVAGPLLLAAVAVDTARAGVRENVQDVALTRPAMRPYLYAWLWGALPSIAVLCAFTGGVMWFASADYLDRQALASSVATVVVFAVALLFYAAVGSLIGRAAGPLAAGLIGVMAGLALAFSIMSTTGREFALLTLGGSTASRIGLEYSTAYRAWQLVLFAAMIAVAYLPAPRFTPDGARLSFGVGIAALVVAIVPFARIPGAPPSPWVPQTSPPPLLCQGTLPDLCLTPQHDYYRVRIAPILAEIANGAQQSGLDNVLPQRVVEISRADVPLPDGTTEWGFEIDPGQTDDLQSFTTNLLLPKCLNQELTPRQTRAWQQLTSTLLISAGVTSDELIYVEPENRVVLNDERAGAAASTLSDCS